jgi:hypothetical protein
VILEVDLDDLVGEAEHDRVLSPHPLLHVHMRVHLQVLAFLIGRIVCTWKMLLVLHPRRSPFTIGPILMIFEVRPEVLHQCDLLMQFFRILRDIVHLHDVLLLRGSYRFPLVVVESGLSGLVEQYFGRVIEKHTRRTVR